jgi:hypothetical protein
MSEDALQIAMVQWLNLCVPKPPEGPFWSAVNPKPHKSRAQAGQCKAMGLIPGTPDLIFCVEGKFVGIEVKQPGKYLSPVQRDVHSAITLSKGVTHTVRSIDDLAAFLRVLGVPVRERAAA